jgi:2-isopropylmalate synthase
MSASDLIFDWNQWSRPCGRPTHPVYLNDETLRDGLQSPSVTNPTIKMKLKLLHLMEALGMHGVTIGLPAAGGAHAKGVDALAREIVEQKLQIRPNCLARADPRDIRPIVDISQRYGIPIEVVAFVGSSPIRFYAEGWNLNHLLKFTEDAIIFARREGLPVMFGTEDTTRSDPQTVRALFTTAIQCGASGLAIADTVGHATPEGARAITRFVRQIVAEQGELVRIDWHGHHDRGLSLINSLAAIEAGADRVHATALGIGERVGNAAMDQLLVNLKLMGWIDNDLSRLGEYCETASAACAVPIPHNYPVFGRDAFRTATGIHAAAIIKSYKKGDTDLADIVYSAVPAGLFGQRQVIEIGPMSGKSNVIYWLQARGIDATGDRVSRIYEAAKRSSLVLEEQEVMDLLYDDAGGTPASPGSTLPSPLCAAVGGESL